jgi:hypothetical protein
LLTDLESTMPALKSAVEALDALVVTLKKKWPVQKW